MTLKSAGNCLILGGNRLWNNQILKGLPDDENPLRKVNRVHSFFKDFLRKHGGFARAELGRWRDLFWFLWSDPPNRVEKVARFIEMAISTNKRIKHRDVFSKKSGK